MNKQELKCKVEELEKELEKFKKELSKADDTPYGDLNDEMYFYTNGHGGIDNTTNMGDYIDEVYYENANYFSDEPFAKKVAAEQTLTNLLRRYTYEHGWSDDLWDDEIRTKYHIFYNHKAKLFDTGLTLTCEIIKGIYFIDNKTAENAIREIVIPFVKEHPEIGYELED